MPGTAAVLFFLLLLVIAQFLEPLAARARVPVSVFLVPLGFAASEAATRLADIDLGIRWDNLGPFITTIIVPSLIFEAATRMDVDAMRRDVAAVFLLALPLLLAAAGITAVVAYFGVSNAAGFPWIAALLAGAILGSTEMTGMFRLLRNSGMPRAAWILEGESIFNDTGALVLFGLVMSVATMGQESATAGRVVLEFLRLLGGGLAVGCACGWLARLVLRLLPGSQTFAVLSFASAYGVFLMAQNLLKVSGALAVLTAGLMLCAELRKTPGRDTFAGELWRFVGHAAGALVFILAGVSITLDMFRDQWLAMAIGIGAVLTARVVIVFGLLGPLSRLPRMQPLSWRHQVVLTWGSVRGSVTLALALSLPLELDYWYTLQSLVYGAVLFSLFVQATTVPRLATFFARES
jgi:CPA1 family monovalent cation:H+ antiporter